MLKKVFLDNLSTTPLDPRVLDSMIPYLTSSFGNMHSRTHSFGWNAEAGVEKARSQVAQLINASPREIIFTSGATESSNLALKGAIKYILRNNKEKVHVVTSQTEHKCVLECLREMEMDDKVEVTFLPVNKNGTIDPKEVKKSIKDNTVLFAFMAVNNEIGTIHFLEEIGKIAKEKKILFFCDAAQAAGKIPLDVLRMNVSLMSLSGHKMYGPKGVGALFVKSKTRLVPLQNGGGQERGLRSGTNPVPLLVGMGKAAEIAKEEMKKDYEHVKKLGKKLWGILTSTNGGSSNEEVSNVRDEKNKEISNKENKDTREGIKEVINSSNRDVSNKEVVAPIRNGDEGGYPGCLNISFPFVEGESLLLSLPGIALSSGSACTSQSLEPSYVLRALGTKDDLAHSSIRFGMGRFTMEEEVEETAYKVKEEVNKLREMSPLYEMVKEGIDLEKIKWGEES